MPVLEPKVEGVLPAVEEFFQGCVILSALHENQLLHSSMLRMIELYVLVESLAPAIEGSDLGVLLH